MWARVYAFGFLSSLYLDQFLWIVYLLHLGYGPAFIGTQYALMQAGRLALDVPSSMFADRFGGRAVLVAGALVKLFAAVLFLLAGRGPAYVLAGSLVTAIALTLPSGVDLAYVRSLSEHVEGGKNEAVLVRRFADYVGMQRLASLGSGLLGGVIASVSFAWLYIAEAIGSLLMLLAAVALPVGPCATARGSLPAQGPVAVLRELGLPAYRPLWTLGVAAAALWAFSSVGTEYSQALLLALRLHPFAVSLVFAAAGGAGWLATLGAGRLRRGGRDRLLRIAIWGYPLAAVVRAAATPGTSWALSCATGGVVLGRGSSGAASMLLEQAIVAGAPPAARATTLSAVNTLQMGLQLLVFPLLGVLSARAGVTAIFVALAAGLLVASSILGRLLGARRAAAVAVTGGNDAPVENE